MYPASLVAYAFVEKGIEDNKPVTQMKLQKLVYVAHGFYLATTGGKALIRESFFAWEYGPVVPEIYQNYKLFGSDVISSTKLFPLLGIKQPDLTLLCNDAKGQEMINLTWDLLKETDAIQLSNWTHKKGSAWEKHYNATQNVVIPNEQICLDFKQFIKTDG